MQNKKAMLGEGLLMLYRLVLITFIALVILGLSAVFYDYYLDVRDAEARIVGKEVVNCLAPNGVLDLSRFKDMENSFLRGCEFDSEELNRFYIIARILVEDNEIKKLEQGDSGAVWVYELFLKDVAASENIAKYKPGYWGSKELEVIVVEQADGEKQLGKINLEVFVNHEF
tara:strand:+ start:3074 stop:3586 length:513 start_codon:yes stop_codon:yes gene_type:complete